MKWFKSCLTAVIIGFFVVPSVQADDVDDINKLVKKKVTIIFDLLGQKDAVVNERNKKMLKTHPLILHKQPGMKQMIDLKKYLLLQFYCTNI